MRDHDYFSCNVFTINGLGMNGSFYGFYEWLFAGGNHNAFFGHYQGMNVSINLYTTRNRGRVAKLCLSKISIGPNCLSVLVSNGFRQLSEY